MGNEFIFLLNLMRTLIGSREFGSLIIQYEAMHHGIYEILPFVGERRNRIKLSLPPCPERRGGGGGVAGGGGIL